MINSSAERNCNLESGIDAGVAGNITRKELLPIRRILAGGTDFSSKRAVISVGPLICSGDEAYDPITFLDRFAFIDVPFIDSEDVSTTILDGYLQFRTRQCLFSLLATRRGGKTNEEDDDGCEFAQLHVENCRTAVLIICGGGGLTKISANFSTPRAVDSGDWHSIKFLVTATSASLVLDGGGREGETVVEVEHLYTAPDAAAISSWRLGTTDDQGSGFTGVLRSIFLNGNLVSTPEPAERSNVHVGRQVDRCLALDEDGSVVQEDSGYCMNGGRCQELYYQVACDCSSTPFTGKRCERDVSYDLVGSLTFTATTTTLDNHHDQSSASSIDHIRFGFHTKSAKSALLRAVDKRTRTDTLAIILTDVGTLRLVYTENYAPFTVEEDSRNYADGYFHDVIVSLDLENSAIRSITLEVDHFRTKKLEWRQQRLQNPSAKPSSSLNGLDWILGDDDPSSLFSGCLSRFQIGRNFSPLKWLGVGGGLTNGTDYSHYRRSMCPAAIRDNLPPEEISSGKITTVSFDANSVSWSDAPSVRIRPVKQSAPDRSIIIGGIGAFSACILLVLMCCLLRFFRARPAGVYKTHEETLYLSGLVSSTTIGQQQQQLMMDSSQQALVVSSGEASPAAAGHPVERREWFI